MAQIAISVAVLLLAIPACDESSTGAATEALGDEGERNPLSAVRGINQPPDRAGRRPEPRRRGPDFRNIDGSENNERESELGAANTQLTRWCPSDCGDGVSMMAGTSRPSPREVSNAVVAQIESVPNRNGASDFLWQWGQFLDHDIDLTDAADPAEPEPIAIPTGDPFFDPNVTGTVVIPFNRSLYDLAVGDSNPRQQLNEITHWVDASNVYGSEDERAAALRSNDGTGKLLVSEGNLLPFNVAGLANDGYSTAADASSAIKVVTSSYALKSTPDAGRPDVSIYPLGAFTQDYQYVAGSGDLDECNGRTGVTPEFPDGIYHYYLTDTFPFGQRCVKGTAIDGGGFGPPPGPLNN